MIEFYFNNYLVNLVLFAVMCVGLTLQIIVATINSEKYKKVGYYAEIAFVIYIAVLTLMPILCAFDKRDGILNVGIYNILAYVFGGTAILLFVLNIILQKDCKKFYPLIITVLTMPYMIGLPFGTFTCFYIISSVAIIIRASYLIKVIQKERKEQSINLLTSGGIDTLDSGILFCNENGYVYLCNKKMQEIMVELFGSVQNNGEIFWNDIKNAKILDVEREAIGQEILLRFKHQTLKCEKNHIKIKFKHYYEIICSDITVLDKNIQELKKSQSDLIEQEKEILTLTNKMIELAIAQEHTKFRTELHDEFGQRLTLFQRLVGSNESNLYEKADTLLDSIENIILAKESKPDKGSFDRLVKFFKDMDVTITLKGDYPQDNNTKELLFYIARECTINAIKHSSASEIYIEISNKSIVITDNGAPPQGEIVEGAGLKGLRARVEEKGAKMIINGIPKARISIRLGAQDD